MERERGRTILGIAWSGSSTEEVASVGDIVTYSYLYKRKHSVGITSFIRLATPSVSCFPA